MAYVTHNRIVPELPLSLYLAVRGITGLCHFRKNYLMPVIICKGDKNQNQNDLFDHNTYTKPRTCEW